MATSIQQTNTDIGAEMGNAWEAMRSVLATGTSGDDIAAANVALLDASQIKNMAEKVEKDALKFYDHISQA